MGEGVKKSISFFFLSFRRKPESSVFKALRNYWTPVFTGVTAEIQFFHTFGEGWVGVSCLAGACCPGLFFAGKNHPFAKWLHFRYNCFIKKVEEN